MYFAAVAKGIYTSSLIILLLHYRVTNCHNLSDLTWILLPPSFVGQESSTSYHRAKLKSSYKAEVKVSAEWVLIWKLGWGEIHIQASLSCWQNLFPCGYRTEVPASLLSAIWGPFAASRDHCQVYAIWPLSQILSHTLNLWLQEGYSLF